MLGTLIGVLPGIGPVATIAMLLPTTYALQPVSALIMLAGIYYGAQYGGSTTAILINMPGESSSVVTCLDGHQMARKGQAGAALAIAALGSFFAGTVATILVASVAMPLSELALKFGPAEYFSLMVLGLIGAVVLAHGSLLKAIAMIILGLLLGIVGTDVNSGVARFAFGIPELTDGIGVVTVAMGLFGFAEIITNLESTEKREMIAAKIKGFWLTKEQFRKAWPAVLRGTGLRLGARRAARRRRDARRRSPPIRSKRRSPRTRASSARARSRASPAPSPPTTPARRRRSSRCSRSAFPENAVMALMVGAMTIHNIQPGPQVMTSNPALFWGLIASMWVGNLMLVVLNLPLIGMWIKLLQVPYRLLYPAILLFCCDRRLQHQQHQLRHHADRAVRLARRHLRQARMRAGAAAARLRARSDDGGEPAPRDAALARRSDGVLHAPAVARHAADGGGAACC